jgi:hypothetical protein
MTYSFASSPSEARKGYFILTATNWTAPNAGTIKGYAVFYEDNSPTANTTDVRSAIAQLTRTTAATSMGSSALSSSQLSSAANQIFDSFELIVASEVAQALVQQAQQEEDSRGKEMRLLAIPLIQMTVYHLPCQT